MVGLLDTLGDLLNNPAIPVLIVLSAFAFYFGQISTKRNLLSHNRANTLIAGFTYITVAIIVPLTIVLLLSDFFELIVNRNQTLLSAMVRMCFECILVLIPLGIHLTYKRHQQTSEDKYNELGHAKMFFSVEVVGKSIIAIINAIAIFILVQAPQQYMGTFLATALATLALFSLSAVAFGTVSKEHIPVKITLKTKRRSCSGEFLYIDSGFLNIETKDGSLEMIPIQDVASIVRMKSVDER